MPAPYRGIVLVLGLALLAPAPPSVGRAADPAEPVYPGDRWPTADPADVGMDAANLRQARDYALTGEGSGIITRHGRVVLTWGDQKQRYDLKSSTKSFGVTALGLALLDGKVELNDKATSHHPAFGVPPDENAASGRRDKVTLLHLATQTAGFEKPGGYGRILFDPGARWHYSDAGPNWLAECLTLVYKRDLDDLMFERVFTPIGITRDDLVWRENQYRPHEIAGVKRREFGAGVSADVDALARFGYLYLRRGKWKDKSILPPEFVDLCRRPPTELAGVPPFDPKAEHGDAAKHYGLLWWNNADGTIAGLPRDAYWSWGLYDSLTVVIPSLDVVAVRAGKGWERKAGGQHYDPLKPFMEPIAAAVKDKPAAGAATKQAATPHAPLSEWKLEWAPPESASRAAEDSDNWPMTWGDDALYTAYGDGTGFEPKVKKKLSLGLARITGGPENFVGRNLPAPTAEAYGDGRRGRKASGMLMVDGVLYLLARNVGPAGHARLAWSADRGQTWAWADWTFAAGFGCPTFVNYGRDYAGAADGYVYVFSPDSDDAYAAADRAVLARVPRDKVRRRDAYEYFERPDRDGNPAWTADIARRGSVHDWPGRCYRSGVTWNPGLKRYLWAMTLPPAGGGQPDGLSVMESLNPWGPWRTVFEADRWDMPPGDSASFPAKWMSADGRTIHLVCSSGDAFCVRKGTLSAR